MFPARIIMDPGQRKGTMRNGRKMKKNYTTVATLFMCVLVSVGDQKRSICHTNKSFNCEKP